MRIGELSLRTGMAPSRIRYYEEIGLLKAVERTPNGYRRYGAEAVLILGLVVMAQRAGFTLEEVRMLAPHDLAALDHERLSALLDRKIQDIETQQARLADSKAHLLAIRTGIASRPDGLACAANAERVLAIAVNDGVNDGLAVTARRQESD